MKKINNVLVGLLVLVIVSSGCESLLDVNSDSVIFPDEHQLNSPNDTLYSMIGIFTQLEKLADRYVLLGELRADLMDITPNTSTDLLEIYNHEISEDNRYNKPEDYYSVINNCNYLITRIDTSIVAAGEKVMYKEYAAAKAIRAWTYLQLALNYESVKYYEEPILLVDEAENYQEMYLDELTTILIQDLEPWKDILQPGEISLGADLNSSALSYFPIGFLLGDLHLWKGNYEQAAREYHDLIVKNEYIVAPGYRSLWTVENGVFVERELERTNWLGIYTSGFEQISIIASSTEFGKGAELDSLTTSWVELIPSEVALNNWNKQIYYHNSTTITEGDLRGDLGSYIGPNSIAILSEAGIEIDFSLSTNIILKYSMMTFETAKYISAYRTGLLYLRYAEAVNRAEKPNLAFATLKNGLNSETMAVDTLVPPHEKFEGGSLVDYVNFEDFIFDYNIGIHERGCGNVYLSKDFVIEEQASLEDSIIWVENKIIEELALETAFEGNRFHDLMRISLRRDDPFYLANKVADKYTGNQDAIRTLLSDKNNWYLK